MMLFADGRKVATRTLDELGDIITGEAPQLGLPKFQRDAVWDAERVELLWDSILRGFPFGVFIVAKVSAAMKDHIKPLSGSQWDQLARYADADIAPTSDVRFVLLDGQQRANAIALGFKRTANEHLWIDLEPAQTLPNDCHFMLYACTRARPWGSRATPQQIEKAREKLFPTNGGIRQADFELPLNKTWPAAAGLPLPLDTFIAWCKSDASLSALQDQVRHAIPRANEALGIVERMVQHGETINHLRTAVGNALRSDVPFLLVENARDEAHDLGVLFTRLNRQGMQMSGEEIFYSSLKVAFPEAHDLVWSIYSDETVGKILPPSKLVHIGSRIIAKKIDSAVSLDSVNAQIFRRLLEEDKGFLREFEKWLESGRLRGIFRQARHLLEYHQKENPSGFPIPMLQTVKDTSWHIVSAWIAWNFEELSDSEFLERNRADILRYIVMESFFVWRSQQAMRQGIFDHVTAQQADFPGKWIYDSYRKYNYLTEALGNLQEIPSPERYEKMLDQAMPWLLGSERKLVLWAQRDILSAWFPDYDPTIFVREDEKPYDFDHILPRENGLYSKQFAQEAEYRALLNAIGNLRAWPKGENRRDQNANPIEKLGLAEKPETCLPVDSTLRHKPCEFRTYGEVLAASYIHEGEGWAKLQENIGLDVLKEAVKCRMLNLYNDMYNSLGFNYWNQQ